MPNENDLTKVASEEKTVIEAPVETPAVETAAATAAPAPETTETAAPKTDEVTEIKAAFSTLLKAVEAKLNAKAAHVEPVKPVVDCLGKSSTAPMPAAGKEVTETKKDVKTHVSANLKVEAMDENWSVSEKELENAPKKEKPAQAMPIHMSVDSKEVASEQTAVKPSTKAMGNVKKFYNQLGPGATGEAPVSVDVKSAQNAEIKLLREALAKEKSEKAAILEKERLNTVADKIFSVVATLKEKNLLQKGKEEAVVDALTQRFASVEALDGIIAVVDALAPAKTEEVGTEADVENKVVPQTELDSAGPGPDAVEMLSKVWND